MRKDTERGVAPARTMGLDLGDRFSRYVVLEANGAKVGEGSVATTPLALGRLFVENRAKVVMEVGTHSPWVARLLGDLGREAVVAGVRGFEVISASSKKSDREDAYTLAELGRMGSPLLRPVHHRGAVAAADLVVIQARDTVVRARTQLMNQVQGVIKSAGSRVPAQGGGFCARARRALPPALSLGLEPILELIEHLERTIKGYDEQVKSLIRERYPAAARLAEVPGVGALTALAFVLTLDDPGRFRKSRDVGPYLGLTPRQHESGEVRPELSISKAGNALLRRLLVQCAHCVIHRSPQTALAQWSHKRMEGTGASQKKRIVVAVARKLAVLLHHLWVSGEAYDADRGRARSRIPA